MKFYLLSLFAIISFFSFTQETELKEIELELFHQEADAVAQNKTLEFGLTLPDAILKEIQVYLEGTPHERKGLNPFVSWDIDIQAEFLHIESKEIYKSYGFWYQDFERDEVNDTWVEKTTPLPFRIRFSPQYEGEWAVQLEVKVRGKSIAQTSPFLFKVVQAPYKGIVTYNAGKGLLERDGKPFYPLGVNLPSPYNKNNMIYSDKAEDKLQLSAWTEYHQQIENYINTGGDYFRMFVSSSSTDIEFEEVGYYQDRQNFAWEMDKVIEFCEENNALIQFNLMYHTLMMKLGDYYQFRYDYSDYWFNGEEMYVSHQTPPSGYSVLLKSKTPSDMFLSEVGIRYLKEKTRYLMSRWGYSNAIGMIELMSEPWHMDQNPYLNEYPYDENTEAGDRARQAVYNYHKEISAYIKDSLEYRRHLLSTITRMPVGPTRIFSPLMDEEPHFQDSTFYLDHLDVISLSYYTSDPKKMIYSKSNKNNAFDKKENSMAYSIERIKKEFNKPVIFGESDDGDETYICSDYEGHYLNAMRYPFTGSIGHFLWAAFIKEEKGGEVVKDETKTWKNIVTLKNQLNKSWYLDVWSDKVIQGREKRQYASSKEDLVEQQYLVSDDKQTLSGYVYNRTFNVSTAAGLPLTKLENTACHREEGEFSVPIAIEWKPQKIKMEGVKALKKYKISFLEYKTGKVIETVEVRSSLLGKLKLTHPTLYPEKKGNPLLWYSIEEK